MCFTETPYYPKKNKMKILYISHNLGSEKTGASQVMARNQRSLKDIAGDGNVTTYYLPKANLRSIVKSLIRLGSYGLTYGEEMRVVELVKKVRPDIIFIESSSVGTLYRRLKKLGIKTICFAHNLDTALYRQEISSRPKWISVPKYLLIRYNERLAARYADYLICLNERDSNGFETTFGRKADVILPITFPERDLSVVTSDKDFAKPYFLFVGSDFFPNVEGIRWFIENVAPKVKQEIHIVGGCCNNPAIKTLHLPENVKLLGYVENVDSAYMNASGVIAPIFKGAGMKTKTIEALSWGKSFYGTSEALEGVDCDYSQLGALCNTEHDFVQAINSSHGLKINSYTLKIFKEGFSDSSFADRLKSFFDKIFQA